ncbi:MAG: exodeoxyribonuclease VII small subunit [Gemmatimonadales bacterium]|nr:MAG: exodeoxyribonuclease VII small subunit [Gemmatimonadales bacterium]
MDEQVKGGATGEGVPTDPVDPGEAEAEELSLEARLSRLDRIVAELEGGEVELERGLELFEEGVTHLRRTEALLRKAELRVEELVGEAESLEVRPFQGGRNG